MIAVWVCVCVSSDDAWPTQEWGREFFSRELGNYLTSRVRVRFVISFRVCVCLCVCGAERVHVSMQGVSEVCVWYPDRQRGKNIPHDPHPIPSQPSFFFLPRSCRPPLLGVIVIFFIITHHCTCTLHTYHHAHVCMYVIKKKLFFFYICVSCFMLRCVVQNVSTLPTYIHTLPSSPQLLGKVLVMYVCWLYVRVHPIMHVEWVTHCELLGWIDRSWKHGMKNPGKKPPHHARRMPAKLPDETKHFFWVGERATNNPKVV